MLRWMERVEDKTFRWKNLFSKKMFLSKLLPVEASISSGLMVLWVAEEINGWVELFIG